MEGRVAEIGKTYKKFAKRKNVILFGLFIAIFFLIIKSIAVGSSYVGFRDVFYLILSKTTGVSSLNVNSLNDTVIMQLRLPRVIVAVIIGASLASTGGVMQGVLRNPLVSEYTLGLSSGAAFGAGLAILFGSNIVIGNLQLDRYIVILSSFIFGVLTMVIVYLISRIKSMAPSILILSGVAISYLFSAALSVFKYVSNQDQLQDIVFWLMGGLWLSNWNTIVILFPIAVICFILMMRYSWDLNALSSGDEVAASLGINVNKVRLICLLICALLASSCVAFSGIIGFVGLVAPHISRIIIGSDYRFLIPCSALCGGILLLLADTLSRTIISPTELPVGIVTSVIGAPFFMYLLIKERRRSWI